MNPNQYVTCMSGETTPLKFCLSYERGSRKRLTLAGMPPVTSC